MMVFLAGTYAKRFLTKEFLKSPYILESFYYFQNWQSQLICNCEMFLLDSGAFTFMNSNGGKIDFEKYLTQYAKFIVGHNVQYFFELDVDAIVGYEKVKEYRKKLENLTGRRCIPVWHKSRGLDDFIETSKEYDYIAIGGIVIKEIPKTQWPYMRKLIDIAHDNDCKIHGLGFTTTRELPKYPFDSVDSTNWTTGSRFGNLYTFNGRFIKSDSFPQKRAHNTKALDEHNIREWIKFQQYAKERL